jgi:hypothetical protein
MIVYIYFFIYLPAVLYIFEKLWIRAIFVRQIFFISLRKHNYRMLMTNLYLKPQASPLHECFCNKAF